MVRSFLKRHNITFVTKSRECGAIPEYSNPVWCMVPEILSITDIIFCHFGPTFDLLPPNNPKKQNLKKWKKKQPGDIIILHMCTINDNHMMYGSWVIQHDRHIFLSFWTVFFLFTPLTTKKSKILKKWKKHLEILSFYKVYHKWQSYDVWFMRYGAWWIEFFVILDWFLHFYPCKNPQNQNLKSLDSKSNYLANVLDKK